MFHLILVMTKVFSVASKWKYLYFINLLIVVGLEKVKKCVRGGLFNIFYGVFLVLSIIPKQSYLSHLIICLFFQIAIYRRNKKYHNVTFFPQYRAVIIHWQENEWVGNKGLKYLVMSVSKSTYVYVSSGPVK